MKEIKEEEITRIQIDKNMRVGKYKGKVRVTKNEGRRIYFDKKRSKEIKTSMLDILKAGEIEDK